jgi:hypothetical protein
MIVSDLVRVDTLFFTYMLRNTPTYFCRLVLWDFETISCVFDEVIVYSQVLLLQGFEFSGCIGEQYVTI